MEISPLPLYHIFVCLSMFLFLPVKKPIGLLNMTIVVWNRKRLAVSVYRSLRRAALRRSLVLLRSASLDFAKLRLTSFAQDDTLKVYFEVGVCFSDARPYRFVYVPYEFFANIKN